MHIGELNRQITIINRVITKDAYGEELITNVNMATVWAKIEIGIGREFFAARKINSELSGIIKIRYRRGLTPDMQIKYRDKTYELISPAIDLDDNREFLKLEVKEVLDNGQQ